MMLGKHSQIALALCAALAATGCGDKKKKSSAAPAPEAVRAEIGGKAAEGNAVKVSYKSNVPGARFKCLSEPQDAPGSDWEDCAAEGELVVGQPGQRFTFKVKAISPSGAESEPVATTVTIPGDVSLPPPTGTATDTATGTGTDTAANASAVILGKDQLAADVQQSTLTLSFGVKDGQGTVEQYRFECLVSGETEWRRCNGSGEHTLSNLEDGKSYSLRVRAVHLTSGATSAEDSVTINVRRPRLTVTGEQQLRDARNGSVRLSFDQNQVAGISVQCQIDQQPAAACASGYDVDVAGLASGQHTLTITAGQMSPVLIPFCSVACDANPPEVPEEPREKQILVGDSVHFTVPETMHVTTYATTQTASTRINFIQVMNDPYFVGNYNCSGAFDRKLEVDAEEYCNVTPNGSLFDWLTDKTVALNHVEVATNQNVLEQYPFKHDRVVINQFDSEYEFAYNRSRFDHLCRHFEGTIDVTPYPIRLLRGFWEGDDVRARFASCYGPIAGTGSELWSDEGNFSGWWIGTFFIMKDETLLPSEPCLRSYNPHAIDLVQPQFQACRDYHQPQLIEVTVMTRRPFQQPTQFAAWAQDFMLEHLKQFAPF